jgi:hypothetical protein
MKKILCASVLALAVSGCAQTPQQRNAGTGALVGAGLGALAGQAIGGNTRSTVAGAAGGAIAGALIGTVATPQGGPEMCRYRAPNGRIYIAECDY